MRDPARRSEASWTLRGALLAGLLLASSAHGSAADVTWYGRPMAEWVAREPSNRYTAEFLDIPWRLSPSSLDAWRRELAESPDPHQRHAAWMVLVREGPRNEARALIEAGLRDPDPARQASALQEIFRAPHAWSDLLADAVTLARLPSQEPGSTWTASMAEMVAPRLGHDGSLAFSDDELNQALQSLPGDRDGSAMRLLQLSGEAATPLILRAVEERGRAPLPGPWIWLMAARAGESPAERRMLASLISHPDAGTATAAASSLAQFPITDDILPLLVAASSRDHPPAMRASALWALSRAGTRGDLVIPILVSAIDDPELDVRSKARQLLGEWGPLAIPHVAALTDRAIASQCGRDDTFGALNALEELGAHAHAAAEELSRAVLAAADRDAAECLAKPLAIILGAERLAEDLRSADARRHERAVRCLLTVVETSNCMGPVVMDSRFSAVASVVADELRSRDIVHRRDAITLMGRHPDESDVFGPAVLAALADDDPLVRADGGAALAALARSGLSQRAQWRWPELEPLLAAERSRTHVLAGMAAGAVECDAAAAQALAPLTRSGDAAERVRALTALAFQVGVVPELVTRELRAAAESDEPAVRETARRILDTSPCFTPESTWDMTLPSGEGPRCSCDDP